MYVFKKTVGILIFNSKRVRFFIIMFVFTFNSMNFFRKLIDKFDNEPAINFVLSINSNMEDIFFLISSPFLPIPLTSLVYWNFKGYIFLRVFS